MENTVLSASIKIKIQVILPKLAFVNEDEANKFRCSQCNDVALYHYFAVCKHVFCAKCHGKYHSKPCPVQDCKNTLINEITQDKEFEFGMNNLQVHCLHKDHGCTDTVKLFNILEHKGKCKFSTQNLLPNVWHPPENYKHYEMIAKLEEDLSKISKTVAGIQEREFKSINSEKELDFRLRTVESLSNRCEKELNDTMKQISKLTSSLDKNLNALSGKLKTDIIKDATILLTGKIDEKMENLKKIFSKEMEEKISNEKSKLQNLMQSTISKQVNDVQKKLTVIIDEKINQTKQNIEESKTSIITSVKNMTKINEQQLNRKLEEHKSVVEEMHNDLKTKIDENKNVLEMYKMQSQTHEDFGELKELDANMQARLKDVEEKIIEKVCSIEDEGPLMQKCGEKITSLKDYMLGDQAAEFQWKIPEITQIIKDLTSGRAVEILSKEYHAVVYGNIVQCKLTNKDKSRFNIELKIDSNCPNCARIYLHRRSFSILDQSGVSKRDMNQFTMPSFGKTQATDRMIGFHEAPLPIAVTFLEGNSRYVKDDCIVVKVVIEPLSILYKSVTSTNGIFYWTLENYTEKKMDWLEEVTPCVPSPCLYTREKGYLVHLEARVGHQLLSFFVSFDKGENDDNLGTEFSHTASLTLLDQSGRANKKNEMISVSKITFEPNPYPIGFLPMKTIELPQYLINDCVELKFQIE